jgi:N-acetylglucosamine kinase-like BadF-type ATPase
VDGAARWIEAMVREAVPEGCEVAAVGAGNQGCDSNEHCHELAAALLDAFSVADAPALARAVNDEPTMDDWGSRAPVVFASADAGSARAVGVISGAGRHLVDLVGQLRDRGAVGRDVVAAGSVIVRQPRLMDAFRTALAREQPDLVAHLLSGPPVLGALALARQRAASGADPDR